MSEGWLSAKTGRVFTQAAQRTIDLDLTRQVNSRAALREAGVSSAQLRANLAARRWQQVGRAVVLHSGPLTRRQRWDAALVSVGPRSMLTGFTAAEFAGLHGWERDWIDVLAPAGAKRPQVAGLAIRLHRSKSLRLPADPLALRCQTIAPALVIAARTFDSPRPACGMFAAAVQQRLTDPASLLRAIAAAHRPQHGAALRAALADIAGGSEALSEIDFAEICRRNGLPAPIKQAVRVEPTGRRRYLDASWRRFDGRLVVVEVDGALHLNPRQWWDDQHRQNELVLGDALVLRFPSVVIRTDEAVVVSQLRRALGC